MSLLFRAGPQTGGESRSVSLPAYVVERMREDGGASFAVDSDTAMRHDAVWSCRTRIAQDVSMMPVDVIRYLGAGASKQRQEVSPPPQIIAAPSLYVEAMDWRYQIIDSWLADGNAWGIVTETIADGRYPARIELRAHSQVRMDGSSGVMRFWVDNVEEWLFPVGRLWHRPAYTVAGSFLGLSPIQYHKVTIEHGVAAQKFGADFFLGGGHPTAILSPSSNPGPEGAKSLKDWFRKATRNREPVIMPQDIKYQQVQINPQDSQFIEAMKFSGEQICRIYGEDPADHGIASTGSSITYANRSDADLARFKRRQFWVVKLQNALTDMLPPPQVVRLNVSASLMMTARERHEIHALRLKSETTTVNEVRTIEDEPQFSDPRFDTPGIPDLLAKADASATTAPAPASAQA